MFVLGWLFLGFFNLFRKYWHILSLGGFHLGGFADFLCLLLFVFAFKRITKDREFKQCRAEGQRLPHPAGAPASPQDMGRAAGKRDRSDPGPWVRVLSWLFPAPRAGSFRVLGSSCPSSPEGSMGSGAGNVPVSCEDAAPGCPSQLPPEGAGSSHTHGVLQPLGLYQMIFPPLFFCFLLVGFFYYYFIRGWAWGCFL